MIEYFKNAKVYELQKRHVSTASGPSNMAKFRFK